MKIIGLTGGIACGKSTVAEILRQRKQYVMDADRIAHDLQQPGEPGYEAIVKLFGTWVVNPMKNLYRARLGKLVFNDPEALAALDAVMHPLVHHEFLRRIGDLVVNHPEIELVVYDAPLLFEVHADDQMDATICVHVNPLGNQINRLMDRNPDLSIDEAKRRIDAQMPLAEKMAKATFCIDNNGTKEDLETNTNNVWNELVLHSGILTS